MVLHPAICIETTRPGARITALLRDTGLGTRAVSVDYTLRAAVGRGPDIVGQAGAGWLGADSAALRERAAGRRLTWVHGALGC